MESPAVEPEPPRMPPELLLRVADFLDPKSPTMLELAIYSQSTYDLIAPMMAESVELSELVPVCSIGDSAASRKFDRIKDLSLYKRTLRVRIGYLAAEKAR